MLLICETCHKHWKLPRGHIRQATCPKCRHRTRSRAARTREAVRRIVREGAGVADEIGAPCTAAELRQRMDEADAKAARALDLARTIAARFTRGGT
jgi:hypothetical protein